MSDEHARMMHLKTYVVEEEAERIKELARIEGVSVSHYLRQKLKGLIPMTESPDKKDGNMKKIGLFIGVCIAAIMLCSCGGKVGVVKNGHLDGYTQTTVGRAFNAAFSSATWTSGTTENGRNFVEFRGKAKREMRIAGEDAWLAIPKDGAVMVQFVLDDGGGFSLGYCEAIVAVNRNQAKDMQDAVATRFAVSGFDFSKPQAVKNSVELARFLKIIYEN
jgi:hypothetical protein